MMIDFAENYLSDFVDSSSNQLFKKLQTIFLLYLCWAPFYFTKLLTNLADQ